MRDVYHPCNATPTVIDPEDGIPAEATIKQSLKTAYLAAIVAAVVFLFFRLLRRSKALCSTDDSHRPTTGELLCYRSTMPQYKSVNIAAS